MPKPAFTITPTANTDGIEDAIAAAHFQEAPIQSVNTGAQKSLAFIAGMNSEDGKGNATFYATYRNVLAVLEGKYSYSACTLNSGFRDLELREVFLRRLIHRFPGPLRDHPAPARRPATTPSARMDRSSPTRRLMHYNSAPINFFQRPDERYTTGAFLHYELNDHAPVYATTMFMDDKSLAQIAASGAFFRSFNVNCANPFLSTQELRLVRRRRVGAGEITNLFIGRRNVEGGGRVDDLEHEDWRVTLGIKGKIVDGWDYDVAISTASRI